MERLLSKATVDEKTGCWLWQGANNAHGYGVIRLGSLTDGSRTMAYVHRVAYQIKHGPIPRGLFVCHKCDVKNCFNPDHLWVGTNSENINDAIAKGIAVGGPNYGEKNGNAKLTAAQIGWLRRMKDIGFTYAQLSAIFGISRTHAAFIVKRKNWKTV